MLTVVHVKANEVTAPVSNSGMLRSRLVRSFEHMALSLGTLESVTKVIDGGGVFSTATRYCLRIRRMRTDSGKQASRMQAV